MDKKERHEIGDFLANSYGDVTFDQGAVRNMLRLLALCDRYETALEDIADMSCGEAETQASWEASKALKAIVSSVEAKDE